MVKAIDILTRDEIERIRRFNPLLSILGILHAWGVIALAVATFVRWPNPITFILAFTIIGARQLGLAILMHDGAHKLLFKNPKLNDFVSQWFLAYPVMSDTLPYRPYHLQHHLNTQTEDDPDLVLTDPFPIDKGSFRRKVFRDLTGQTGLKMFLGNMKRMFGRRNVPMGNHLVVSEKKMSGFLISNALLFAIFAVSGHWSLYFLLWVLPWLTFFQFVVRIRSIAEHAVVPDNEDDFRNTRTTLAGPLARAFIAPYNVNYHIEHHLFTFVPWYNLPKVHRLLKQKGYFEKMEIGPSYWSVLQKATSKETAPTPVN